MWGASYLIIMKAESKNHALLSPSRNSPSLPSYEIHYTGSEVRAMVLFEGRIQRTEIQLEAAPRAGAIVQM